MIEEIYKKIWALSPQVYKKDSYDELASLTKEMIGLYDLQGRLSEDPFSPTRLRKLGLAVDQVNLLLENSTCLVTGGLGCVGSTLVGEILKFDIKRLVILDKKQHDNSLSDPRVVYVECDVRDL
ncbi:MAG TPA: hypothetical protein VK589_14810, partial [Chryseolinea sp.]|nr:hypothetical protein [Chryseolinea sp.]